MNKSQLLIPSSLFLLIIVLFSCKKEENNLPTSFNNPVTSSGFDGEFYAFKVSHVGLWGNHLDSSVARFWSSQPVYDTSNAKFATKVICEGEDLVKDKYQYMNRYGFHQNSIQGNSIQGTVNWVIIGSSQVASFAHNVSLNWPTVSPLKAADTIKSGQPYTMSVDTMINADSIVFEFAEFKSYSFTNITKSVTFTSNQLPTNGYRWFYLKVYNSEIKIKNGRRYYFANAYTDRKIVYLR
ncbi:MAG: hypothetical protein RH916_00255 [Vicingaceae bacterium]